AECRSPARNSAKQEGTHRTLTRIAIRTLNLRIGRTAISAGKTPRLTPGSKWTNKQLSATKKERKYSMSSPITSPLTSSNGTAGTQSNSNSSTAPAMDKLANEQTFLQLFVSQLKNQDPLNPADGTQFVSQLAQFSQLEQTIGIAQNIGAIRQQVAPATTGTDQNTTGTQSSN